jgi:hypothetical protein
METTPNTPEVQVNKLVTESFAKELFATQFRSFDINPEMMDDLTFSDQDFIDLVNSCSTNVTTELMATEDNKYVEKLKEIVYTICQDLPEFNNEMQYTPVIIGSNALFQQKLEHIPLHAYEHVPLVFTFVLHTGDYTPPTYFADARGGVTTTRQLVAQNLVSTSFQIKGRFGEVFVTPGHLMRYTETNLDTQAYVTLNIKVGFGR